MREIMTVAAPWINIFTGRYRLSLEDRIIGYVKKQRWFGGKGREIKGASFIETVPVSFDSTKACIAQVQIKYTEKDPETYVLPLSFATGERADQIRQSSPGAILAEVAVREKEHATQGI